MVLKAIKLKKTEPSQEKPFDPQDKTPTFLLTPAIRLRHKRTNQYQNYLKA